MVLLINSLGWFVHLLPDCIIKAIVFCIGRCIYYGFPRFRHTLLSNLNHAFPERPMSWIKATAKASACGTVEMGMLGLIGSHYSVKTLRRRFTISPELVRIAHEFNTTPPEERIPIFGLVPHFSLMECLTMIPLLADEKYNFTIATMFRPLDNSKLDEYIKNSRETWGVGLLSRREGLNRAMELLRTKNVLVLLFDQNAGRRGSRTLFFDQVCPTSELPGMLAQKFKPRILYLYARRTGFMRGEVCMDYYEGEISQTAVTINMNRWLENKLRNDDSYCRDWLWLHRRWKSYRHTKHIFMVKNDRDLLKESCEAYGYDTLPKRFRVWIRMPNWLGDVIMALPLIQTLQKMRPDIEITLIAQPGFRPFLERVGIADNIIDLPKKGWGYYPYFYRLRYRFPDIQVNFTNSLRGDLEAWLIGAPYRLGMVRKGHPRPLLHTGWKIPDDLDLTKIHQTYVWQQFMDFHGVLIPLDLKPLSWASGDSMVADRKHFIVGMICGTENMPEKRWPVKHWRTLIEQIMEERPDCEIHLFGTKRDRIITDEVADNLGGNIKNRAGETNLVEYCDALRNCTVVVCNDTGGMHLANALGIPIVAIFGPTNPVRTGPVFDAPKYILQPEGAPATGAVPIDGVSPEQVLSVLKTF